MRSPRLVARANHAWRHYVGGSYRHDGTWRTWCGRKVPNTVKPAYSQDAHPDIEGTTCLNCLKAIHDHELWKAEMASSRARASSIRLTYLQRSRALKHAKST